MYIQRHSFGQSLYLIALSLLVLSILTGTGVWVYILSLPSRTLPPPIQMATTIRSQDKTAAQVVTTQYMHIPSQ